MKKTGFILLLILIFVLVVGVIVGYYYVGTKDDSDIRKGDDGGNDKVVTYEVTDQKILDILQMFDGPGCDTVIETYLNDHTVYAKDIPFNVAASVSWHRGELDGKDKVSIEELEKSVQKYFGTDYELQPKEGDGFLCVWKYNVAEKAYVRNPEPACGCGPDPGYTRYRTVKAVQTGDTLEIDLRVAFYRVSGDCFYEDYEATRSISTNEMRIDGLDFYDSDVAYSKASLYRMTFKENNGNYVFVKAEKVN